MTILGINSYFEHPAAALIKDGEVVYAVEDERFTGIKHGRKYSPYSTYLPINAIYRALHDTGTTVDELTSIAYSYERWTHLTSLWGCLTGHRFSSLREELTAFFSLTNVRRAMRSGYEIPERYRTVLDPAALGRVPFREWRHHLSHAASAFYCSGWPEALVAVADGAGERATTSVYVGKGRRLTRIGGTNLPHSLGITYSMMTRHLGFEPFSDEFKVMGLAAYGEPRYLKECQALLTLTKGGGYHVDTAAVRDLARLFGRARDPREELEQRHMDVAASIQQRLEEALVHVVKHHLRGTGLRRLCLAGGTFLNCVANGKLARLPEVEEVFVQPASHDAGTALGAAALSWVSQGGTPRLRFPTAALGTGYSDEECARACRRMGVAVRRVPDSALLDELAKRLEEGEIGAVFRGRMEFGPRALGMRSILASPVDPHMRERLNDLKGREGFRPVAPMIKAEAFDAYFDGYADPYMLFTSKARDKARVEAPGAIHVDGSARVQTVWPTRDPWLHELLTRFADRTSVPILINTSLNLRGRPIAESPSDALACLFTSTMDFLVLGNLVVDKPRLRTETGQGDI